MSKQSHGKQRRLEHCRRKLLLAPKALAPAACRCSNLFVFFLIRPVFDNVAMAEDPRPSGHYLPNYSPMSRQFPDNHPRYRDRRPLLLFCRSTVPFQTKKWSSLALRRGPLLLASVPSKRFNSTISLLYFNKYKPIFSRLSSLAKFRSGKGMFARCRGNLGSFSEPPLKESDVRLLIAFFRKKNQSRTFF